MRSSLFLRYLILLPVGLALLAHVSPVGAHDFVRITGRVVDSNGAPLAEAMVSLSLAADHGADRLTLFTDDEGRFKTPMPVSFNSFEEMAVLARKWGFEQVDHLTRPRGSFESADVTVIMRPTSNEVGQVPPSAWLAGVEQESRSLLIRRCAGCHQVPSQAMFRYARLIERSVIGLPAAAPADVRGHSWDMIQKYMNILAAAVGRRGEGAPLLPDAFTAIDTASGLDPHLTEVLAEYFTVLPEIPLTYAPGAPLLANPAAAVVEYGVSGSRWIRDALLMGPRPRLWMAGDGRDSAVISLGLAGDDERKFALPPEFTGSMQPFTVQRGADGTLWVTSSSNSIVAQFDVEKEAWRHVWKLPGDKISEGILGLSYDNRHDIARDGQGRIWFSIAGGPTLGYFVPETGETATFAVPGKATRPADSGAALGALAMSPDGNHVWYARPDVGVLGAIDTRTFEFRTLELAAANPGPHRPAFSDEGILYVPLFVSGQLLAYDPVRGAKTLHELPDGASAPYAATFDPLRKVLWVSTSNADALYRFDPETEQFSVLPLPRPGSYLRRVAVDPVTSLLVSPYMDGNEPVSGPRRILTIDPGDKAYEIGRSRGSAGGTGA